jgi:hypothetical protein
VFSVTKDQRLNREIMAPYCENHREYINILCVENVVCQNGGADDTYSLSLWFEWLNWHQ